MKDEEDAVSIFLESVLQQTKLPSEMVIVDGGSMDGTARVIDRYMEDERVRFPIKFIRLWDANIARGRNLGIAVARHDIIAVSDVGCILSESWLKEITRPFDGGDSMVVAGNYLVRTTGHWDSAAAAMTIPDPEEIAGGLPSSRSIAFRRRIWEQVGGYPEYLDWAEDTAFSLAVKAQGFAVLFAKSAMVYWRPRSTPLTLFLQYYRYAAGDGLAGHFRVHYLSRIIGFLVLVGLTVSLTAFEGVSGLIAPAGLVLSYWLYFVGKATSKFRTMRHLLCALPGLLNCDTARSIGYVYGCLLSLTGGKMSRRET